MQLFFPLDQLKTKLNFQFSYDQLGPLSLFFLTEFPMARNRRHHGAKHAHKRQITEFKYGGYIRLSVGKF